MNNTETDSPRKLNGPDNADLEYILELFDSKELGLTIAQDNEQNQRCSSVYLRSEESKLGREDINENTYRAAFTSYFKNCRQEAVLFIDAAIRFMNCIKKMKIQQLLEELGKENALECLTHSLITAELLADPIEEELTFRKLSQKDRKLYEQALKLLKSEGELTPECKKEIQNLLSQVESQE